MKALCAILALLALSAPAAHAQAPAFVDQVGPEAEEAEGATGVQTAAPPDAAQSQDLADEELPDPEITVEERRRQAEKNLLDTGEDGAETEGDENLTGGTGTLGEVYRQLNDPASAQQNGSNTVIIRQSR